MVKREGEERLGDGEGEYMRGLATVKRGERGSMVVKESRGEARRW